MQASEEFENITMVIRNLILEIVDDIVGQDSVEEHHFISPPEDAAPQNESITEPVILASPDDDDGESPTSQEDDASSQHVNLEMENILTEDAVITKGNEEAATLDSQEMANISIELENLITQEALITPNQDGKVTPLREAAEITFEDVAEPAEDNLESSNLTVESEKEVAKLDQRDEKGSVISILEEEELLEDNTLAEQGTATIIGTPETAEMPMEQEKEDDLLVELDGGSDSEGESTQKPPKRKSSTEMLLEILECDEVGDLPNDSPSPNKNSKTDDKGTDVRKSTDKPHFMHIDTEKDQEKTSAGEQDEVAVDPIGESSADWSHDDAECIVPDTNQTQEEQVDGGIHNGNPASTSAAGIENPEWEGKYVVNISNGDEAKPCMICAKDETPKYTCSFNKNQTFICSEPCLKLLKEQNVENVIVRDLRVKNFAPPPEANPAGAENIRSCADCGLLLTNSENYLSWECLEFCDLKCIKNYQKRIGSYCCSCEMEVSEIYLGKYCVRFGFDIRQFCSGMCLIKYKKGLKVCSFCRENMQESTEGTNSELKVKTRDFCSVTCKESYTTLKEGRKVVGKCAVCHKEKPVEIEFSDALKEASFCSEPCFVAFKYVNNVVPEKCGMCSKYYRKKDLTLYMINAVGIILKFCSKTCQNVYINIHRKIVSCCWCKVKKYNFDMIQRFDGTQAIMWCSLNCQRLYEGSGTPSIGKRRCSVCYKQGSMIYHITSDVGLKSFCSYKCVRDHQTKQMPSLRVADINTVPTIIKRVSRKTVSSGRKQIIPDTPAPLPIITSVRSLAPTADRIHRSRAVSPDVEKAIKYVIMVRLADLPDIRNVSTTVKPLTVNQESLVKPTVADKETQTDIFNATDMEVVPIPIFIPHPIHMFNFTHIKPMPFTLPIPVPILMPMTKTGTSGILKEVKTAQPTPSDPYEADLLVMAQLVADANDKDADDEQAVESEPEDTAADDPAYSPEPPEQNTSFGDDVLQMALHMATDFTEPAVDLEGALTANTITATSSTDQTEEAVPARPERASRGTRKRGRSSRGSRGRSRGRSSMQPSVPVPEPAPEPPAEPAEKPDANMCLKYTFGVNAWKQWVTNKNNELEKSSRRVKLFKTDLLQLTSDELNYSLCLFIKEVRKPNGAEYAPDTIYYLCLGVQQYLFENGRIDNIFCDPYYESFTDSLDDICKKFSTLYNDSQYIVTRVEEEHLWESKQLGAHSPHVLLSTLMFFNTKHFNLTNVDEHMQLSFSHIMKHWKRVPNTPGTSKNSTSRNILLRFYPPQSAVDGNRKKKVYEQQENEENPIRCPVKLYEFYLSKCPESVKTRNDVFYLQPERSCVPDSPVWYSTMALGKESLEKMLHRVKMVKEINVALLSS